VSKVPQHCCRPWVTFFDLPTLQWTLFCSPLQRPRHWLHSAVVHHRLRMRIRNYQEQTRRFQVCAWPC
jgi:hypothetical protein